MTKCKAAPTARRFVILAGTLVALLHSVACSERSRTPLEAPEMGQEEFRVQADEVVIRPWPVYDDHGHYMGTTTCDPILFDSFDPDDPTNCVDSGWDFPAGAAQDELESYNDAGNGFAAVAPAWEAWLDTTPPDGTAPNAGPCDNEIATWMSTGTAVVLFTGAAAFAAGKKNVPATLGFLAATALAMGAHYVAQNNLYDCLEEHYGFEIVDRNDPPSPPGTQ